MSEQSMSERQSSLETLRETHSFPCAYEFKVIGSNSSKFIARVIQVVVSTIGAAASPRITTKESAEGTYVSISMELEVDDAESILDVYAGFGEIDGVKFVL